MPVTTVTAAEFARIRHGDRVTILVPAGQGRNGQEWAERTGRAVMRSAHGGWVLNMGVPHGTPGLADESNTIAIRFGRGPRAKVCLCGAPMKGKKCSVPGCVCT